MFIVNVKTNNENDGCFSKTLPTLDEVRVFIKTSAAAFRNMAANQSLPCTAFILRSGTLISQGKEIAC